MSKLEQDAKPRAPDTAERTPSSFVLQRKCACGGGASAMTGQCGECEEKKLHRRAVAPAPREVPPIVGDVVATSGTPLDPAPRQEMESRFGHDFGSVRIHTGDQAAESARSVGALAYTVGSHIVFGTRQYAPATQSGRHLLAHELTHTIQQRRGLSRQAEDPFGLPTDSAEVEAERTADAVTAPAASYVVEDDALPGPGQMRKTELLDELQRASCIAADEELARVGRSTEGCPYIERAFTRYRGMPAAGVERTLRRWIDATSVTGAHDYVPLVARRVTEGVSRWATTGDLSGVPPEIAEAATGGGSVLGMLGGFLGNLFFKRGGDAPATPGEAAMVSTSLGRGSPLESGVRGRMESAFGYDFSRVRIHSGETAAGVSSALGARAFTFGGDVGFGAGEYRPNTLFGDALIAHELAHVVQQSGGGSGSPDVEEDADHSAAGAVMALWGGAKGIARSAMPRMRSGLRLQQCTSTPKKPPATPVKPVQPVAEEPQIVNKIPLTAAKCYGAADERTCEHEAYVNTVLPAAIGNIKAVKTPYSEAVAKMYEAALPAAKAAPPPPPGLGSSKAEAGSVTVTFAGTTHTFPTFFLELQNQRNSLNGRAWATLGVVLNEGSTDALTGQLASLEATMVHEMMHVFSEVVTQQNASAPKGSQRNLNLDDATYAGVKTKLETALLPMVQQIHALPSMTGALQGTPELNASVTAHTFISETIARTEAGIYVKQREGGTFAESDLPSVLTHIHTPTYWSPDPPKEQELIDWVKTHATEIDQQIGPLVDEAGKLYLKERPKK